MNGVCMWDFPFEFPENFKIFQIKKYHHSAKKMLLSTRQLFPGKVTLMPDHQHVWVSQRFFNGASNKKNRGSISHHDFFMTSRKIGNFFLKLNLWEFFFLPSLVI